MIKKLLAILLLSMLVFTACSKEGEVDEEPQIPTQEGENNGAEDNDIVNHKFDVKVLADELFNNIEFDDKLVEGRDIVFLNQYALSENDIVKQASYFSSNATTEEIAVIECEDSKAAEKVKKAVETRVGERKSVYESYAPDEVKRLDGAIITVLDNYVVLCVTSDVEKAEAIIEKY